MNRYIDLVGSRRWLFAFSGVLIVASLLLLAIPPSLRPGIEFTSGTTALLRFETPPTQADLRAAYTDLGHSEARIQSAGDGEFLIRTSELDVPVTAFVEIAPTATIAPVGPTPLAALGTTKLGAADATGAGDVVDLLVAEVSDTACILSDTVATSLPAATEVTVIGRIEACGEDGVVLRVQAGSELGYIREVDTHDFVPAIVATPTAETATPGVRNERAEIEASLQEQFGAFEVLEFAQVSPVVSRLAVRNASIAVVVASLFIMGYVVFAFSSVPKPLVYATCAIIALIHDVTIVLGAFSLFGRVFGIEINLMFVTGLLTVIGFSVHDSIVVFDRIRENVTTHPTLSLAENVNHALLQTMARSFNTSVTVLLTVLALLLLGGETIREFLLVVLVGVVAGTYSSIAIASQLLVSWEEHDVQRLWARLRGRNEAAPAA